MRPNLNLMKATLTGALGGLLFGFDTVVISGIIDSVVKLYGLSDYGKGWTVAIALIGTVVGSFSAGVVGNKLGSRETLRLTAVLYVVSALGSALAWNWPSLMVFRFIGGLGIGASSVLGPVYIAELAPAKWRGRLVGAFQFNVVFGILVAYTSNYLIRLLHLGATEWRWQVGVAAVPAKLLRMAPWVTPFATNSKVMSRRSRTTGRSGSSRARRTTSSWPSARRSISSSPTRRRPTT